MNTQLNRQLWGAVSKLGSTIGKNEAENAMRTLAKEVSGSYSTKLLTDEQVRVVLARLGAFARPQVGGISDEQQHMLERLRLALSLGKSAYIRLCQKVVKKAWPQSSADAVRMHECLEAMLRRRWPVAARLKLVQGLQAANLTPEDRRFVGTCGASSISISALLILIKIGRRYGLVRDSGMSVADGASDGQAAVCQSDNGEAAAV